jgi:hypothetical protein
VVLTNQVDFHPEFQQIAAVDMQTGELQERRLKHPEEAETFYRELAASDVPVRVGMLASGHARWFERLLGELQRSHLFITSRHGVAATWPSRPASTSKPPRGHHDSHYGARRNERCVSGIYEAHHAASGGIQESTCSVRCR